MKLFRKKKTKIEPKFTDYGIIAQTEGAAESDIDYDFNKEIVVNGNKMVAIPYSDELEEIYAEVYGIPIVKEIKLEEDFKFDDVTSFGFIEQERNRL